MESYHQALQAHKLRATVPRQRVFDALAGVSTPLSMADLIKRCSTVDRVTLYRTLTAFLQAGIVRIVPVGWKRMYELTESFVPHHHHMICTQCGAVIDIMSSELEEYIADVSGRAGFMESSHMIEIRGRCQSCQEKNKITTTTR